MIRPLTIATCLLACGSGLYLYQEKHEVQLLDRTIERTVHDTNALREQSRLLAAEWTMLNDPERLRQFSDTYLNLKTITPTQFTSLTDLDTRLPTPQAVVASQGSDEPEPVSMAAETASANAEDPVASGAAAPPGTPPAIPVGTPPGDAGVQTAGADEALPVPPIPAPRPAPAARTADARAADRATVARQTMADNQPRPVTTADVRSPDQRAYDPRPLDQRAATRYPVADGRPADQRSADQRLAEERNGSRFADAHVDGRAPPPPRPIILGAQRPQFANAPVNAAPQSAPARPAMVAASAPYGGSLLGMARGSMPPAPRPTPVNATYNSN
jgi:hypothetical protein